MELLVNGGYFDASKMGKKERNGSIYQAAKEKVCSARRISLQEYCEGLGVGIVRSILSQEEKTLASGGVCGVLVELLIDPFWFVGILFLVGGVPGWSMSIAATTVVGGEGNKRLWQNN